MLEVHQLHAGYGEVAALRGVSLSVGRGEIVTVIGSNGAGKSTLLRTLSGLVRPTAGEVRLDGQLLSNAPAQAVVRAGLAHVPEGRHVFPELSIEDNLRVGAYLNTDRASLARDLQKAMALFPKLAERRRQAAGTLSGGEQQMLALGRALMSRPRLLMLDEPSLGLAPKVVDEVLQAIVRLRGEGMTILLVEQNANLALGIADRAYVMAGGRVTAQGPAAEVATDETVRASYLGRIANDCEEQMEQRA